MKISSLPVVVIASLCFGYMAMSPALAQESSTEDRWHFKAAIYLWAASIDGTTRRGNEVNVGFSDLFDNLDGVFMGAFEARKSKWSLATDIIYLDVSANEAGTIGPGLPVNADVDITGWVLNVQGARNVLEDERATIDILLGARYLDVDSTLTLRPGASGPTGTASASDSVWDGVIGVKGNVNISGGWYLPYYLDVGTGQSDFTWQGSGGIGYSFKWANVALVYRHMYWDFASGSKLDNLSFSGPVAGVAFKF